MAANDHIQDESVSGLPLSREGRAIALKWYLCSDGTCAPGSFIRSLAADEVSQVCQGAIAIRLSLLSAKSAGLLKEHRELLSGDLAALPAAERSADRVKRSFYRQASICLQRDNISGASKKLLEAMEVDGSGELLFGSYISQVVSRDTIAALASMPCWEHESVSRLHAIISVDNPILLDKYYTGGENISREELLCFAIKFNAIGCLRRAKIFEGIRLGYGLADHTSVRPYFVPNSPDILALQSQSPSECLSVLRTKYGYKSIIDKAFFQSLMLANSAESRRDFEEWIRDNIDAEPESETILYASDSLLRALSLGIDRWTVRDLDWVSSRLPDNSWFGPQVCGMLMAIGRTEDATALASTMGFTLNDCTVYMFRWAGRLGPPLAPKNSTAIRCDSSISLWSSDQESSVYHAMELLQAAAAYPHFDSVLSQFLGARKCIQCEDGSSALADGVIDTLASRLDLHGIVRFCAYA